MPERFGERGASEGVVVVGSYDDGSRLKDKGEDGERMGEGGLANLQSMVGVTRLM